MKEYLARLAKSPNSSLALLFAGFDKKIKEEMAIDFASKILKNEEKIKSKNHPDLHFLYPEGKLGLHTISSIRKLIDEVNFPPFEASHKIFIIHDADRMQPASANALLKTFEEPSKQTIILLLAPSPQDLIPTIVSRCRTLYFRTNNILYDIQNKHLKFIDVMTKRRPYPEFLKEIKAFANEFENVAVEDEFQKSIYLLTEIKDLFVNLFLWFRDLYIISQKLDLSHLCFKNNIKELKVIASKRKIPALKYIDKTLNHALKMVSKTVPLSIIFEDIYLKLSCS